MKEKTIEIKQFLFRVSIFMKDPDKGPMFLDLRQFAGLEVPVRSTKGYKM